MVRRAPDHESELFCQREGPQQNQTIFYSARTEIL